MTAITDRTTGVMTAFVIEIDNDQEFDDRVCECLKIYNEIRPHEVLGQAALLLTYVNINI